MPQISKKIISFINTGMPFTLRQIEKAVAPAARSKIKNRKRRGNKIRENTDSLKPVLSLLLSIGYLSGSKKTYRKAGKLPRGKIKINTSGNGVLLTEGKDEILIEKTNLKNVYNNDLVEAEIIDIRDGFLFGRVAKVVEREKEKYFARLTGKTDRYLFFTLLDVYDREVCAEVTPEINPGKEGDFAVIRLRNKFIAGRQACTAEKFYAAGENFDVQRVIVRHNLPGGHGVYKELDHMDSIIEKEQPGRKDYAGIFTVTIDGETAKDFDDAVSIEKAGKNFRLYVHIADVSAFVKRNGLLDKEALKRGNSYYLGNTVIPMLPEILSNNLCSLREGEKRLTLSVEMVFDGNGNELSAEYFRGVINVDKRLTYNFADKTISESGSGNLYDMLILMKELAAILKKKRLSQGRVDLNLPDYDLIYEDNELKNIRFAKRLTSHGIIEEFMLSANETVSRALTQKDIPALYRIHETISKDKLVLLKRFLQSIGITLKETGNIGVSLQNIIDKVSGKEYEKVVNFIILKSFMQAYYGPDPLGHFGLGFTDYTHFTSPIRRYPDLVVHRCLKSLILKRNPVYARDELEPIGLSSSRTERTAQAAERDLFKLISCRFMEGKEGEVYDVIISGISKGGFFVMLLDRPVEGMVPFRNIGNDYYITDEDNYTVTGRRTGKKYRIGDTLKARLVDVAYDTMRIDFEPA